MKANQIFQFALAAAAAVPAIVVPMQAEAQAPSPFKDVSANSPYFDIIHEMRDRQIISGYENGEFRPSETLTRKHAAALVNRAVTLPVTEKFVPFKDVSAKNAFYDDIKKLQQAGIFEPDENGNVSPNIPITRAEMAKVLAIAFDLKVKVDLDFLDVPRDHPESRYIKALYSNGITTGDFATFNPNDPVTRVHYAVFLHRLLHKDDPVEPGQKIRGQFARITEQGLAEGDILAQAMLGMLAQKITKDPADYLITEKLENGLAAVQGYPAGHSLGQMAKENIVYLKRFAEKESEQEAILDKWMKGDFSAIQEEYFILKAIGDPEFFNCTVCDGLFNVNIRTDRAEEHFVRTIYGEEGLQRHREQWGK